MKARVALPFAIWPERDRVAWEHITAPGDDLYGIGAAAARLRPDSIETVRLSYGCWLGFLARINCLEPLRLMSEIITPDKLDAFVTEQRARGNGNAVIKKRLACLHMALRLMEPEIEIGFIRRPGGVSLDQAFPHTPKRTPVRDTRELVDFAIELHRKGLTERGSARGHRMLRDAAIIGLLASRAPRVGSLGCLRVGVHLTKIDECYSVFFDENIVKTHTSKSYPLDELLTPVFDDYLSIARPAFGNCTTGMLWLRAKGMAFRPASIAGMVKRRIGHGPHWLRKCLITTVAAENPELTLEAAMVLGHSPRTSLKHYNMASATRALHRHSKHVTARRKATCGSAARCFARRRADPI